MFKPLLAVVASALATVASAADYTSAPLRARTAPAAGEKPFQRLDSAKIGFTVPNIFDDPRMWGERFRELTLGAVETGVAVADFNLDGRLDIFAVSKNGPCALYVQTVDFQFVDIAPTAGVAIADGPSSNTGATAADVNRDGHMDLYVCRYDLPNLLFINNGDGTFTERGKEFGLDVKDASVQGVFADYDRDGHLDCYLVTNILDFAKSPQGRRHYLFRNTGNNGFTDVTAKAGIWGLSQGHTAIWFDPNHDGWPDIYVSNDFETPDRFYLNKGDGTFVDVVDERLPHVTYFSMGADAGDINNDGLVDFIVTDMRDRSHAEYMTGMEEIGRGLWEMERVTQLIPQYMWNAVYLNTGTDRFKEIAHLTGMEATGWSWAARFGDLDTDGRIDTFVTSGMIRNFIDADLVDKQNVAPTLTARAKVWQDAAPRAETTLAYRNLGDLKFDDVSAAWGLDHKTVSFGCALADFDGDGDLDLVYSNYNAPPTLVRNYTTNGHRVVIKLVGRASNIDGLGAELVLESASGKQVRQIYPDRGIATSEPPVAHFGLGEDDSIKRLSIRWPSGQVQTLENLPVDRWLRIEEPELPANTKPAQPPAMSHSPALFAENAANAGLKYTNSIRPFDEFTRQRLLPRRLNGLGPVLATADVNGDSLVDVFVSGTAGQPGQLFLAQSDGNFTAAPHQPWSEAAAADDVGAVFLDVNGDKHPDLLIAAGGVQHASGDALLNDRLYLNDGHGRFAPAPADNLPADGESTAALATADFDGDGRSDVFIGGRVVPGKYPETPRSFLLRNVDGKLTDVTDELAPALRKIGMVTAAAWSDVDADGRVDLLLALEWGPIAYFRNTGTGFENATEKSGLAKLTGWWSALTTADVNGDGRLDLIAGNVGLNTKYRATIAEPTLLYSGDLDGNGRPELIEAQFENGRLYPLRGRSKLGYAMPSLPRKFSTYKAFAGATVEDIFGADRLASAQKLAATELASGVFIQQSNGAFAFQPLPRYAQIAPINTIVARDFDGDGQLDLFCAGNNFGPEPNTGRFDGSLGVLLRGNGRGEFTPLTPAQSGIVVTGDARSAAAIPSADGRATLVVARCDGPLLFFTPAAMLPAGKTSE